MKNEQFNLGLVSVSFRQHRPQEILEAAQKAGISLIEWGSDIHAPCHDTERLMEIAALQREYGVTCSSYGTYFRLGETPMEELRHYIAAAKLLGTDVLRLWCGKKSGADLTEAEKQALLAQCLEAEKIAREENVTLCMECHRKTLTERLPDAIELMERVNSPHFRMYWQPFQWQSEAETLVYAQAIAPYTRNIHVFQWKGEARFPLREGIAEWRSYLGQFSLPHTLLLEFMPDDAISSLPDEVRALRTIIGG